MDYDNTEEAILSDQEINESDVKLASQSTMPASIFIRDKDGTPYSLGTFNIPHKYMMSLSSDLVKAAQGNHSGVGVYLHRDENDKVRYLCLRLNEILYIC